MTEQNDNSPELASDNVPIMSDRPAVTDAEIGEARKSGLTLQQIADRFGISRPKVQRTLDRLIRSARVELGMSKAVSREAIAKRIFSLAPSALETVAGIASSERVKPDTRLRASQDILDRAGFAPVLKTVSYSVYEEMPRDALLADIRRMLADAGNVTIIPGDVIPDAGLADASERPSDPTTEDVNPDDK